MNFSTVAVGCCILSWVALLFCTYALGSLLQSGLLGSCETFAQPINLMYTLFCFIICISGDAWMILLQEIVSEGLLDSGFLDSPAIYAAA